MTRVRVRATGRRIAPFDDPPDALLILNRPLSEWRREALAEAGLTLEDDPAPPYLEIPDTLFTTGGALRAFVDGAAGRDAVLVLADSVFGRSTTPVQPRVEAVEGGGWRFADIRFVSGRDAPPVDVVVDPDEEPLKVPAPSYYIGVDHIEIGIARHPLMTLHHWVHLLWANQVAGGIEVRNTPKWKMVGRLLWAALRAFSINKWKVMARLNTVGKGCDIHPTAVVEASQLGDNVRVGPHARVLMSRVDDGAEIMANAQIELSTIGREAMVCQNCCVRLSVLYPQAVASMYLMQLCVLGEQAVTTVGTVPLDLNFQRDIRVELDGALHSTGTRLLGSAVGHRAKLGSGLWIASGRSIPSDYFVIRDPDDVLQKAPDGLPLDGPLRIRAGQVEPL